jgi:hypothetical protein
MANIVVTKRDGSKDRHNDCGYSLYNGKLYIWYPGKRKGRKPKKVYTRDEYKTFVSYRG